ncbi:hypothetical protein BU068_12720 [Staphylococcus succinus]|uniref:hypothetical protein n=1 Tax=Staphylococcus succinus TaxID=61015 RepID=UPI000E69544B|nr:hypothetical protein [Staphylococcus succinus]RIN28948.1 hypothetical protein BU068_12720 [Staphylococcus succinus]
MLKKLSFLIFLTGLILTLSNLNNANAATLSETQRAENLNEYLESIGQSDAEVYYGNDNFINSMNARGVIDAIDYKNKKLYKLKTENNRVVSHYVIDNPGWAETSDDKLNDDITFRTVMSVHRLYGANVSQNNFIKTARRVGYYDIVDFDNHRYFKYVSGKVDPKDPNSDYFFAGIFEQKPYKR